MSLKNKTTTTDKIKDYVPGMESKKSNNGRKIALMLFLLLALIGISIFLDKKRGNENAWNSR